MANASTTQTSSASDTTGTPIPLDYGYVWVTGKRHAYNTLQNTGDSVNMYTRVGLWLLGHGEWDGAIQLWINDRLVWRGGNAPAQHQIRSYGFNWLAALDNPNPEGFVFNFHVGCDTPLGASLTSFTSTGPDQNQDVLWPLFPPAIDRLPFSRIAYYTLMRKQPIVNQTSNNGNDATQWTDIAPLLLCRALRCRLFDDEGNQTGYAFTTNPIWHYIDLVLRRKLFPDYGLDPTAGPDAFTAAVGNRFNWGELYQAAQYCDEFLANGNRRFEGNYSFAQQTSLQACQEQILLSCRGFATDYAGKIGVKIDMPRSSVFTFSRAHILPGSWQAGDQALTKSANRYLTKFRDVLVPLCSYIQSITCTPGGNPEVTTTAPHPFEANDWIAIGGTDTTYDGEWEVYSVPDVINEGTATEIDPSTFVLVSKGTNYPASVGEVGGCGLLYSRFKERTPEFWHKNNMLARGALGVDISRLRNKVKQTLDFATTTWDQASRLTCYERDRLLGVDQSPYVTPPAVKFRASMFAHDAVGNLACAIRPGDHVTLDPTTNFQYANEYEVLDLTISPPAAQASGQGGEIALKSTENSGEIELSLGPYNEAVMYDTSDPTQAGWPSVPGSYPGNSTNFTAIPLANGNFSFFTGSASSGSVFQLPTTGYPSANTLAWASPAGIGGSGWSSAMATIELCDASSTFLLTLKYEDNDGSYWVGPLNYACLAWLSSDVPATSNGLNWISLTLEGGEEIVFGRGIVAGDGSFTIALPAGFTTDKMFAVAYPHDGVPTGGHDAHWVGAFVDSSQVVHLNYKDGEANVWHGNASVLVFAWKNNIGTWTTQTLGGNSWAQCPINSSMTFGVGCALGMADGSTLTLPMSAGNGSTLEAMVGTSGWDMPNNDNHAHGVNSCYLDANNQVHITFSDGSGNIWAGLADIFALYYAPSSAVSAVVNITPSSATIAAGATLQFSAAVLNNANQSVTWAVDGIAGGNVTVGTISSGGLYAAPDAAGSHTIIATSIAAPTAFGSAAISTWGMVTPVSGNYLTTGGNIIDVNDNPIYVI
jgi:hypothetical protein